MTDHRRRFDHDLNRPAGDSRVERRAGERGQILATTGISLIALLALVGVAVDLGYFLDDKRQMQTAADSAAMAGAEQLWRGGTDTQVTSAASNSAASNAFTNGTNSTQVTVNHPPVNGFYAGNPGFVEVIISQPRPTIFMGILGFPSQTVSTSAVAGTQNSPNCIYALNPTANQAFNTTGSASINASCGVVVDSISGSALNSSGSAGVHATLITVTGNTSGCCWSPTPQTGVPPAPDPLAGRAQPTVSTCNFTNFKVSSATKTLTPGVYCNGIGISGGSSNVTFMPGVYILNGGGFSVSGGGTINGDGVTFFNTGGAAFAYKPIAISGGTSGTLSAPTSGLTEGILFFQDRTITTNANNAISGGSTLVTNGALYFPTQHLDFSGGSSGTTGCNIIVASTITFSGPSTLSEAGCNNFANGNPLKKVALAD